MVGGVSFARARRARHNRKRVTAAGVVLVLTGGLVLADPASAQPRSGALGGPGVLQNSTASASPRPPAPAPLAPVDPGPDGSVRPATTGSPALTPITALPAIDPGPDAAPVVPKATVTQQLPVTPSPITLATTPGQHLVDDAKADAVATIGAAGPYVTGGVPNLDANQLQPQVSSAQVGDPTQPATLQQLTDALATGDLPPNLPLDALALLQKLPNGIPQITYRVCSESATKPVSCSNTLPIGVPAIVNVTGNGTAAAPDRTPDVLVELMPFASIDSLVSAVNQLLSDQRALASATQSLNDLLKLLLNPLYLLSHPEALLQKLNLQRLVSSLQAQVAGDLDALTSAVSLGVGLLQLRLGTSEVPAHSPLAAHVWAVYDIPGYHRISVGYDGFRRGTSLPWSELGIFTLAPADIARGIYDVRAEMYAGSPGSALAITAGISNITTDGAGTPYSPIVASARFSPVPDRFVAHGRIDPSTGIDTIEARSSKSTQLDALVFIDSGAGITRHDQYLQLKVDKLPEAISATLVRPTDGSSTTVSYRATDPIDDVLFTAYGYNGAALLHALKATAHAVPKSVDLRLAGGGDSTSLTYRADSALQSLGLGYFEQAMAIGGVTAPLVARGALTGLPTVVTGTLDSAAKHLTIDAAEPLGSLSLQGSFQLGAYAPLAGDHATYVADGKAFGVDARISGFQKLDAWYDAHPRISTTFSPGGQSLTGAGVIDGTQKFRAVVSNVPATMSIDIDPAGGAADYRASSVIDEISAAYVDTAKGPSLVARLTAIPDHVHAQWTLGATPHVQYDASSQLASAELFASPQGVETVDPLGNDYLSAKVTDLPSRVDVLLDFPGNHVVADDSAAVGRIVAAARAPFAGRSWTAIGELDGVPANLTVDFGNGNFDFRGVSGPLGKAAFTVSNHGEPAEPTGPAHLALHYDEVSGDLDASASIVNLTEVGYLRSTAGQHLVLTADLGDNPLQLDADVVLKAGGVADTRLAAVGEITGLPANITIDLGVDGAITYTADKHVGITLGIRVGKVAALTGLGAPLPANGIAAVARTCTAGAGCAAENTPFCLSAAKCLGAVANVNVGGLPTTVTIDTGSATVTFKDYQPSAASLSLYVRLVGIIDALPDVSARAVLSGLPSSLDFTAGPFNFGTGDPASFDARYTASEPLGTLSVDLDAQTTNSTFPVVRANATISDLPAQFHLTGTLGGVNHITVDDSAPIPSITAKVTNATSGYLQAALTGVPAKLDYVVDGAGGHAEGTMSGPIAAITALAHIPYQGRTWSAFGQLTDVPGHFTADFGDGSFGFHGLSGALGSATFAVTNHTGATVPALSSYLAAHYDQLSGDIDAGAKVNDLTTAAYGKNSVGDQTFDLAVGAATIGLDADVVLKANGARDTELSVAGTLTTPNTVHVDLSNSHIVYTADRSAALRLTAKVGKVAALAGLGAPLYPQGVAVRARGCAPGTGCAGDGSVFCSVFAACFGAVANVVLPGLPETVDVDVKAGTVDVRGLHPSGALKVFAELDGLLAALPDVRALATVTGLPSPLDLTVGPFGADPADPTTVRAGYSASGPLGRLQVDADAQTTGSLGTVRGQVIADGLPATFSVSGRFGSASHIHVGNSAPIDDLRVQATATLQGSPASGLIDFSDVPATMDIDVGAAGTAEGVNVPTFTYAASGSTLDGLAQVDARLTQNVGPAGIGTDGAYFRFTNLGADTKVRLDPGEFTLQLTSTPATTSFQAGANLRIDDMPNQDFDKQVFDIDIASGHVVGHYGVRPSKIDDIELDIEDMSSLRLVPGKAPFGLPKAVGLMFPGVTGDYGSFAFNTYGVDLNPDVEVGFKIEIPALPDGEIGPISLPHHIDSLVFHKFDTNGPKTLASINFGVACLNFKINPEPVGKSINGVTMFGSDGPQAFSFFDINDLVPDIIVDVFGAYTFPFMDGDISVDGDLGPC